MGREWQQVIYVAEVMKHYPATDKKSRSLKLTLLAIAAFADNSTGKCWVSAQTAASMAGVSPSTFWRNVAVLEAQGVLSRSKRSARGLQIANGYQVSLSAVLRMGVVDDTAIAAAEVAAEQAATVSHNDAPTLSHSYDTQNSRFISEKPPLPPNGGNGEWAAGTSVCGTLTDSSGFTIGTEGLDAFMTVLGGTPKRVKGAWNRAIARGEQPDTLIYAARCYARDKAAQYRKSPHAFLDDLVYQDYTRKPRKEAGRDCPHCGGGGYIEGSDGVSRPCPECSP